MGEGFDLAPLRGVLHGKSMYDVSVDPMIFFPICQVHVPFFIITETAVSLVCIGRDWCLLENLS
jgi:hypothetical protein